MMQKLPGDEIVDRAVNCGEYEVSDLEDYLHDIQQESLLNEEQELIEKKSINALQQDNFIFFNWQAVICDFNLETPTKPIIEVTK